MSCLRAVVTAAVTNRITTGRFTPGRSGSTSATTFALFVARALAPACGW